MWESTLNGSESQLVDKLPGSSQIPICPRRGSSPWDPGTLTWSADCQLIFPADPHFPRRQCNVVFKDMDLDTGCLALNPGSATSSLCDLGQLFALSVPVFLICKLKKKKYLPHEHY